MASVKASYVTAEVEFGVWWECLDHINVCAALKILLQGKQLLNISIMYLMARLEFSFRGFVNTGYK